MLTLLLHIRWLSLFGQNNNYSRQSLFKPQRLCWSISCDVDCKRGDSVVLCLMTIVIKLHSGYLLGLRTATQGINKLFLYFKLDLSLNRWAGVP